MAKALDGCGLEVYCRQLAFSQEIQEMIDRIRATRPSGDLYLIRGSTYVGYPNKKMGGIIRAESYKVEFSSILELEYSSAYEEDFLGKIRLQEHVF
jgi:hypothetical protein